MTARNRIEDRDAERLNELIDAADDWYHLALSYGLGTDPDDFEWGDCKGLQAVADWFAAPLTNLELLVLESLIRRKIEEEE